MRGLRWCLVLFLVLAAGSAASGDDVFLKNGNWLRGSVVEVPGGIRIRIEQGSMTIPKDQIERVEKRINWLDIYREKEAEVADGDADGHYRLGLWCREHGLPRSARLQFHLTIREDPDHAGARSALGYVLRDGVWMTKEEVLIARGYVRRGSRWISPEALEREKEDLEKRRPMEEPPPAPDWVETGTPVWGYIPRGGRGGPPRCRTPVVMYTPTLVVPRYPPAPPRVRPRPPAPSGVPSRWQLIHRRSPPPPSGVPSRVPAHPPPPARWSLCQKR